MPHAEAAEFADNDRSRITQWSFAAAGASTGPHVHEFDYIVVPVTGGDLTVISSDGSERAMMQVAGVPYTGTAGTRHNVVASSEGPIVFVEVELKGQQKRLDA